VTKEMPVSTYWLGALAPAYDAMIVAGGAPVRRSLLNQCARRARVIVALDGGADLLHRARLVPRHVVGDLDSISDSALTWAKRRGASVHRRTSQDEPDFAKGLAFCRHLGCRRVLVLGFSGQRTDHVLAALHHSLRRRAMRLVLLTDQVAIIPLRGRANVQMEIPARHTISWIGFPRAGSCTLTGVRWPFRGRTLKTDGFHSLSNQPAANKVTLSQKSGASLVVMSLRPEVVRRVGI